MSKAKLEYARELIQEKRYAEARDVLGQVHHPTAAKWLKRLEDIAPATTAPRKQSKTRVGCWIGVLAVLILGAIAILTDPRARSDNQSSPAGSPISSEPTVVEINDPYATGLPETFLSAASQSVAQHGYINWYEAEINRDRRLIVSVEVTLTNSQQRSTALHLIADLLKQYAASTTEQNAGSIEALVSWQGGAITCTDNAGIGYMVMRAIHWETADPETIFRAIDQNVYADSLDG